MLPLFGGSRTLDRSVSDLIPDIDAALQRALLDEHTDFLSVLDAQGRLVFANQGFTRLFGWEVGGAQQPTNLDLIHPDDLARITADLTTIMSTPGLRVTSEYRLRCKDGRYCDVESNGINLLNDPRVRGIVTTTRDISARRRAEAEARASHDSVDRQLSFARTLYRIAEAIAGVEDRRAMLDAVVRIIGEGLGVDRCQILDVSRTRGTITVSCEWLDARNPSAFSILGDYPLTLLPHTLAWFWETQTPLQSHAREPAAAILQDGMAGFLHGLLGSVSISAFPFHFRDEGFYLLAVDTVTAHRAWREDELVFLRSAAMQIHLALQKQQILAERRQAEAQLQQSQKMEAIGRLAGGIAHDFNNLLTAIVGYADLLDLNLSDERLRRYVDGIHQVAHRATATTHQLLAFSRQQVQKVQVFELGLLMTDIQDMLRRLIGERIELVFRLDPKSVRLAMDPVQLELALVNLAVNARDAMPSGGRLTISTALRTVSADTLPQLHLKPGAYALIQVSDDGMGMAQEVIDHLFEPFFTTKELGKGTGLGLSSVYGIVRTAGGGIEVHSSPGTGSVFSLYLPQDFSPVAAAIDADEAAPASGGSETVLMVEDDDILRDLLSDALRSYGYQVLVARDGHDALAQSQRHERIDLVLSDVVMPHMDGPVLARALAQRHPHIKLLFMSGYTADAFADKPELRQIPILAKPFAIDELVRAVRQAIDQGVTAPLTTSDPRRS